MLLLPPIIDYVIFGDFGSGLGVQYEYQEVSNLIPILKNLWNPMATIEAGSKGQGAMFLALLFGFTIYVALKLDSLVSLSL